MSRHHVPSQALYWSEGTEMAMLDSQKRELYLLLGEAFTLTAQGRPMDYAIASALSHQVWPFGMGDLRKRITRAIDLSDHPKPATEYHLKTGQRK
jgi:hypothetical protein